MHYRFENVTIILHTLHVLSIFMYASGVLLHKKNIQDDRDNLNCKIKCSRKDMQDLASVKKI